MRIPYSAMAVIGSHIAEANDRQRNNIKSRQENSTCEKESLQERKDTMRTSIVGKILMALIFASVIGGISAGPALAKNDNRGRGPQHRGWQDNRGHRMYRPGYYGYQPDPIYAPPPVIYAPEPSPGIGIFFPPIVIR